MIVFFRESFKLALQVFCFLVKVVCSRSYRRQCNREQIATDIKRMRKQKSPLAGN